MAVGDIASRVFTRGTRATGSPGRAYPVGSAPLPEPTYLLPFSLREKVARIAPDEGTHQIDDRE